MLFIILQVLPGEEQNLHSVVGSFLTTEQHPSEHPTESAQPQYQEI